MKIKEFLAIAGFYRADPKIQRAVETKNHLFIGAFTFQHGKKFISKEDCLRAFADINFYFNSTHVQINFGHLDKYCKANPDKEIKWNAHVCFISDGFKKMATGTAVVEKGKVVNYSISQDIFYSETKNKKGFLGITFFPAHERIGAGVISNETSSRDLVKTYEFSSAASKENKVEFFFVSLHKAPAPEEKHEYLKNFIVL